jgi:glyoxylase-like metal-dependent hydrolase (beta-lactamase superfamily II)
MVRAGSYWWDGGAMFGVVPKTLWSRHCPADDSNRIEAGFNCFVVETGDQTILIETGGGIRHDDRAKERMRLGNPVGIAETLAQHGFEAGAIDLVINTHLHWDHCCGNTIDEGGQVLPALPKARYVTQRGELEHAREQNPRDAVSYRAVNYEPLLESGRMHLLDGDVEVSPGIEVRVAPGHNRDMMVVIVRSGSQTWCQLADLTPFSVQVTPTWVTAFDLYPLQTIASKEDVLSRAADEGWWVSFAHDPRVNFAQVQERDGKWTTC